MMALTPHATSIDTGLAQPVLIDAEARTSGFDRLARWPAPDDDAIDRIRQEIERRCAAEFVPAEFGQGEFGVGSQAC